MRLSNREQQELHMNLLEEWKQTHSLVLHEMLKQVAEPLIANAVEQNKDIGVRKEDVRATASALVDAALFSYSPSSNRTLVEWIETRLGDLPKLIESASSITKALRKTRPNGNS